MDLDFNPENEILFYSNRNINDVLSSYARREKVNVLDLSKITGRKNEDFIRWIIKQDELVMPYCYYFSYEKDINGQELILQNKIEKILGVEESKSSRFTRSELKKYTDSLERYDPTTEFWPNHIS